MSSNNNDKDQGKDQAKNQGGYKSPWAEVPNKPQQEQQKKPVESAEFSEFSDFLHKSREKLKKAIQNKEGKNGPAGGGPGKRQSNNDGGNFKDLKPEKFLIGLVAFVVFVIWLCSGVYTVDTKEAGVILRLGKYNRTTTPGLNYHLPAPFEEVRKINVTERNRTDIGAKTDRPMQQRGKSEPKLTDGLLMLTGDENLVDVTFEVQWQIADAKKYLFNVYDPQLTLRNAAESAMREMIGTTTLGEILSAGRGALQQEAKELLQNTLDSYDSGIHIEAINMRGVPPTSAIRVDNIVTGDDGEMKSETLDTTVDEAFKDVQAAIINKEEIINMARARSNEVIPEARGQAEKLIQEAQGYKEQIVAKAEGESARFLSVYKEYAKARDVTKKRLYIETMEQILDGMDKIILDGKNANVLPYLPLKEIGSKQ